MRPLIGVLPLISQKSGNFWINPLYMSGVEQAGGAPVLLTQTEDKAYWTQMCDTCDGFVFTGGPDIEPALYGHKKIPECDYIHPLRDTQELWMLQRLITVDKPLLGICRGIQILNVAAGGTMYQDIEAQRPGSLDHQQADKVEFTIPVHSVNIAPSTKLHAMVGEDRLEVNSIHHQAVWDVAPDFIATAWAEDGLVEGIESTKNRFVVGVQWHPEFLWKEYAHARAVFRGLVTACEA